MADPSFLSAYKIVPIILLVFFFQGWTAFVDLGIYVKGNTNQFVYATLISIAIITLGYVYFIPIWGVRCGYSNNIGVCCKVLVDIFPSKKNV